MEIKSLTLKELEHKLDRLKFKRFRAKQVFQWIYEKGIFDFNLMSNISKEQRNALSLYFKCEIPEIVSLHESKDGTVKFAIRLKDDNIIESVIIPDESRNTLCLSTQAGCRMGCRFCFTGKTGFKRNLFVNEIIDQIILAKFIVAKERKITNLVFMGMGEPFDNYENTVKSLDIILDKNGFNFSSRKVTVSTCGIIDKMKIFGENFNVNLAVSLHSAYNEKRTELMPVNKKYPLEKLMEACKYYPLKNRQRITFEYVMIKNFNDSINDAKKLVFWLGQLKSKVNLITFNSFPDSSFYPSHSETVRKFQEYLVSRGISTTIRKSKGSDILAACGQLAGKKKDNG
jgi:23S rRNA (adenine2503-C2)-methyltransferase